MYLLNLPRNFFEIAIFTLAVVAFIFAVRFFIQSQKRLQELFPLPKKKKRLFSSRSDKDDFVLPVVSPAHNSIPADSFDYKALQREEETKQEMRELKAMLKRQQAELDRMFKQLDNVCAIQEAKNLDTEEPEEEKPREQSPKHTGNEIPDELQLLLKNKDAEIMELRHQIDLAKKMKLHFGEVEDSYNQLQHKIQLIEQQAWQAADIAVKMDNLEQSNAQLEKNLLKKEEKLRELTYENTRLQEQVNETDDKLTEANLQRQQLMKKVQLLEEAAKDIQQLSDTDRRLKNEMYRVAELESLLLRVKDERDGLLKKDT